MSTLDIVLIVILGLGAIKGYQKGIIVEIFSLLAFFFGLIASIKLALPVSEYLFEEVKYKEVTVVISFLMLFIGLIFGIRFLAKMIKGAVDFTIFGTFDNLLGAAAGILKVALVLSIIMWVLSAMNVNMRQLYEQETIIFPYIIKVGPTLFEYVSTFMPFMQEVLDKMGSATRQSDVTFTFCFNTTREAFL